jgi:SpoVK/Ycf46/Vps4 family AAA+-type ATPase
VIQTAEAVAPAVLWIDEIEKGLSGSKSSGATDGGTSTRVFGGFISWLQEKQAPVFIVATANDVSQLPPAIASSVTGPTAVDGSETSRFLKVPGVSAATAFREGP